MSADQLTLEDRLTIYTQSIQRKTNEIRRLLQQVRWLRSRVKTLKARKAQGAV